MRCGKVCCAALTCATLRAGSGGVGRTKGHDERPDAEEPARVARVAVRDRRAVDPLARADEILEHLDVLIHLQGLQAVRDVQVDQLAEDLCGDTTGCSDKGG